MFDINNLVSIAQTRLDALGDHLWFLQTEPAYMRRYVKILMQGELYKVVKPEEAGIVVMDEPFVDVQSHWWWAWVKKEREHVKSVRDRFRDSIRLGERLPHQYDRALGALELLLVNLAISCAGQLLQALPH